MGEISPLFVLLVVWWLVGLLTSGRRTQQRRQQRLPPERTPTVPRPGRARAGGGPDATQREGSRLEQILREFEQALEEASQPKLPRPPEPELPWDAQEGAAEEVSLEEAAVEIRSLEEEIVRPEREVVVLGGDPDELQRRRVAYAEARNRALTSADHRRFDARIRAPEVAEVAPVAEAPDRTRRLRQAIIWREVLGPPVSLRDARDR